MRQESARSLRADMAAGLAADGAGEATIERTEPGDSPGLPAPATCDDAAPPMPGEPVLPSRLAARVYGEFEPLSLRFVLLNAVLFFMPHFSFNRLRTALYRFAGVGIGVRTLVLGSMELSGRGKYWRRLKIGDDCQITSPLYLDLNGPVTIGDRVAVGHHVVMITTDHDHSAPEKRCGAGRIRPIVVEEGAWIGARATVLPGVTIGRGSVVAAGAVVAADVEPHTLVGGVPARRIRSLPDEG